MDHKLPRCSARYWLTLLAPRRASFYFWVILIFTSCVWPLMLLKAPSPEDPTVPVVLQGVKWKPIDDIDVGAPPSERAGSFSATPDFELQLRELDTDYETRIESLKNEIHVLEVELREARSRVGQLADRDMGQTSADADDEGRRGEMTQHAQRHVAESTPWWESGAFADLQSDIERLLSAKPATTITQPEGKPLYHNASSDGLRPYFARYMASNIRTLNSQTLGMYSKEAEIPVSDWLNDSHVLDPYAAGGIFNTFRRKNKLLDLAMASVMTSLPVVHGNASSREPAHNCSFVSGLYKRVPSLGATYEMSYETRGVGSDPEADGRWRVILSQAFAPVIPTSVQDVNVPLTATINIILVLDGAAGFQRFLSVYRHSVMKEENLSLTVVHFGADFSIVEKIVEKTRGMLLPVDVVHLGGRYNVSHARSLAARRRPVHPDTLLFFVDVSTAVYPKARTRCRLHSRRTQSVYHPIPFSLYNPAIVYTAIYNERVPSESAQHRIDTNKGFWDVHSYDSFCLYQSDFLKLGEMESSGSANIAEVPDDLAALARYDLNVVRVPDPHVFSMWRPRHCEPSLPHAVYRRCVSDKAIHEASHAQLGFLVFQEYIDIARDRIHGQKPKDNHA